MTGPLTTQAQNVDGVSTEQGAEPECGDGDGTADDANDLLSVENASGSANAADPHAGSSRPGRWLRILSLAVFPALAMIVALLAGYLKWVDSSAQESDRARAESASAARDGAIAMLSYQPATVEQDLTAVGHRLTGSLQGSYESLIHDVVIPGSRQRQIAATTTVPAAATISASPERAVVLVFVDQTITVGTDPATSTASRVRVTMNKVGDRWLIAGFDPI